MIQSNTKARNFLTVACAGASFLGALPSVVAQPNTPLAQRLQNRQRPNIMRRPVLNDPTTPRAKEILQFFLREGHKASYTSEETTRLLTGRVRESVQIVKHGGQGRHRIEYLEPDELKGEILLLQGGKIFKYEPKKQRILEGISSPEDMQLQVRSLLAGVKSGQIGLRVVGSEILAGQSASIVEIRPSKGMQSTKRLWIDDKTGVRLKIEEADARGIVLSTSYATSIAYSPQFALSDFSPAALPSVPHEALLPSTPPLGNVAEAQAQVGYTIREPLIPMGFELNGVWVENGRGPLRTTILRYSNGVVTYTLFQRPLPQQGKFPKKMGALPPRIKPKNGSLQWVGGEMFFNLIGNLNGTIIRDIVNSLR